MILECTLDDVIDLPLAPTRVGKEARIKGDTVTWITSPENAGTFAHNDDPATGARFRPSIEGRIVIAVAAQTISGAVLKDRVELDVLGLDADALNLSAKKIAPEAAAVLSATVEPTH